MRLLLPESQFSLNVVNLATLALPAQGNLRHSSSHSTCENSVTLKDTEHHNTVYAQFVIVAVACILKLF